MGPDYALDNSQSIDSVTNVSLRSVRSREAALGSSDQAVKKSSTAATSGMNHVIVIGTVNITKLPST